ncbi:alpha/beta fold hydrolase [Nocardioides anomalus]|uniref:Alpha/beta fold hydrolase n=1 Tax=Nocardioides anomalus TaxID=2712223 RepID=A0A6G6W8X0_9ACTN|nr:alpha/beta fold hydrolase [Nocardioides anomalus]QIG41490.1 alpha/beta fold hydrolase [Nocardioides anomalus]
MTRVPTYDHDGLTFDVRDRGPADGDPVVLLHGFPERAEAWRKVEPLLHEAGLRTLAPDQRGYSPGARPPRRHDYTVDRLVGDVVALIERLGRPVHLVGHDWGSAVGWSVAQRHPALVRTWTAVSVPHPGAFVRAVATSRQVLDSWYMLAFQLPYLPERVLARPDVPARLQRSAGMSAEDAERFRVGMVEGGALRGGIGWYRALPFAARHATGGDKVRVPTTMVWSDRDRFVGRRGVELTPAYVAADYRLVELAGVSHWIPTQAPEALATAVLERIAS